MKLDNEERAYILKQICNYNEDTDDFEDSIEFIKGVNTIIDTLSRIVLKQSILQTQILLIGIKALHQNQLSRTTKQECIDTSKGCIAAIDFFIGSDTQVSVIPTKEQIILHITEILIKNGNVHEWTKDQIRKKAEIIISYYAARNYCINGTAIESWYNLVKGWLSRSKYLPDVMDTAKVQEVYDSLK